MAYSEPSIVSFYIVLVAKQDRSNKLFQHKFTCSEHKKSLPRAWWPSGRVQDCGARSPGFNTHLPGLEVIKLFSSSAQLSMKFQQLINAEIVKINEKFWFKTQKL